MTKPSTEVGASERQQISADHEMTLLRKGEIQSRFFNALCRDGVYEFATALAPQVKQTSGLLRADTRPVQAICDVFRSFLIGRLRNWLAVVLDNILLLYLSA